RNANALIAMRDRENFREGNCRMFRRRVNSAADLREQSCRRARVEKVSTAALYHAREHGARRINVRHDMYVPASRPAFVRRRAYIVGRRISVGESCVRAKEIDRSDILFGF